MSDKQVRYVNVIPHAKIKKESIKIEDEVSVQCKACNKTFITDTALNNHVRMEHIDLYRTGDPKLWAEPIVKDATVTPVPVVKKTMPAVKKERTKMTTAKLLSSMGPTSLMSLASEDVSYIIIKADPKDIKERKRKAGKADAQKSEKADPTDIKDRKRKAEKAETQKSEKVYRREKDNEPHPITGPFECLQPSSLVADGACHQMFFSCCEYSAHCRDEHTRRRKGVRCQVCEKPLAGGGEPQPQSPFPCDVCGADFQTNKELSDHMVVEHVKLKPFECSVCHKRFTQQGGVQQHMRMHTGDRPFPCTFCSKAFTQKSGLDQHLRIHTKVKPYRCIICSKTFCQSVHLKQHMRTHTNFSPFQCGICSKRFKQSSHLNYHLKNHSTAAMSAEQKAEYHKLLAMMPQEDKSAKNKNMICVEGENGEVEYLEVNEVNEDNEVNEVEVEDHDECEVVLTEDQEEQLVLAEGSIQDGDTYILGDCGETVWSVKVVENESDE